MVDGCGVHVAQMTYPGNAENPQTIFNHFRHDRFQDNHLDQIHKQPGGILPPPAMKTAIARFVWKGGTVCFDARPHLCPRRAIRRDSFTFP